MKKGKIRSGLMFAFILLIAVQCTRPGEKNPDTALMRSPVQEWRVLGPGGGGGVMKPAVSPFDENFVLTYCDMTGVFVSTTGGAEWKMKNLWNVPEGFEFDPADPNTVYAATRGFMHSEDRGSGISLLLRSADRGEKWEIIYPDVSKAKKADRIQSTRLLPSEIIEGALDGTIQKIKVDPDDNKRIYLGISPLIGYIEPGSEGAQGRSLLLLSADHGNNWEVVTYLPDNVILAIFPEREKNMVTVLTDRSCLRINEITGETTTLDLPVNSVIVAEGGKDETGSIIYIQSEFIREEHNLSGGIYISRDMGQTWMQRINGLTEETADGRVPAFRRGLGVCRSEPEVAYISMTNPVPGETGQTVAMYSIYKTTDAGESWHPVLLGSSQGGYSGNNFTGSWLDSSYGPGWGGSPIDLGVAPGNPDVCYAGDNGRIYRTTDGGKTWVQRYSVNNHDGSYTSNGLNVTTCYNIHFDPFDEKHLFISYTDIGLFHSYNGGTSWLHSIDRVPRPWQNTCYDLVFDPDVRGKLWSVWANAHDLPRTKMFGSRGFDHYLGGVALSEDGGLSWQKSNTGIPENSICTNIILDRSSAEDSRTLYVAVFDKGIYKSNDGGSSWVEANTGLGDNLFAWQLRQNSDGRLYALFSRGLREGKTVDGVIYYSDNGAGTWEKLELPEGVNGPHDLLISPVSDDIMYVSCWPRNRNGVDSNGGLIRTDDGGLSWEQVFDERVRVNSAASDHQLQDVLYINTFQNAAYRSPDAGNTWERIEGYRFKWGQRAIPDIHNPGMLFLTTFGGSVFYGPAEGVPGAAEDIINMPEGWW